MNAAAALVAAGKAEHLRTGVGIAAQSVDSGKAAGKLDALVSFTRSQA
jgi:anthranilate phosphoribosyltransferase